MWRSYTITAIRNLMRNRFYTVLNLVGLAVGICAVLLIALYIHYELTWDRHIPGSDQVYRVLVKPNPNEEDQQAFPWVSVMVDKEYLSQVPGIAAITHFSRRHPQIRQGDVLLRQEVRYADSTFMDIFRPTVLEGDPSTFLHNPDGLLLTRSAAMKFFGETYVTGRTLLVDNGDELQPMRVEGVLEDPAPNETVQYEVLAYFPTQEDYFLTMNDNLWQVVFSHTWLRLESGANMATVEAALHSLPRPDGEPAGGKRDPSRYILQPLNEVHLTLSNPRKYTINGNPQAVGILSVIAMVVLLLACINYAILTVGRSTFRQREIGVRKVLGAQRGELGRQFWLETAILVACALIPALLLVELLLPVFNNYADTALSLHAGFSTVLIALGAATLATTLAGLYPAMVMTRYPILNALKNSLRVGGRGGFRRGLLLLQLGVTILLGSVTTVMVLQLNFIVNRDLGYTPDNLVTLHATAREGLAEDITQRLQSGGEGSIDLVSASAVACTFGDHWNKIYYPQEDGTEIMFYQNTVSPNFLETCTIPVIQGRDFRPDEQHGAVIVNEAFVRDMELDAPVGATIPFMFGNAQIVGVTPDFHYHSLHDPIDPMALLLDRDDLNSENRSMSISQYGTRPTMILARLEPGQVQESVSALGALWQNWVPDAMFDLRYVEDELASQYSEEKRWNSLVAITAGLAILIALLGIAGVTVLQVLQRSKEIGIRKTLGASVSSILTLLSRETVGLIIFASAIAGPIAWVISQRWLATFAFRVDAGVLPMIVAASVVLVLAVSLVLALSYRLSQVRPADVLRDE